ncbi:hypothetical protein LX36DRAFT_312068 [Colletotrichum falcatum]|nr:hypothetical protein LX36DRAFT_312068 [Colletotrichum falcatum]
MGRREESCKKRYQESLGRGGRSGGLMILDGVGKGRKRWSGSWRDRFKQGQARQRCAGAGAGGWWVVPWVGRWTYMHTYIQERRQTMYTTKVWSQRAWA